MNQASLLAASLLAPAPKSAVQTAARRLAGRLGRLSRQRLETLIRLMGEDGRIGYLAAYDRLFPDHRRSKTDKQKADKAFSKFRHTLQKKAAEQEVGLELRVDSHRGADPTDRRLWFAAEDDAGERLAEYSRTATHAIADFPQEQRAAVQGAELTCLLVYAQRDRAQAQTLIQALAARLQAAGHNWDLKDYGYVPPGEIRDQARLGQQRSADLTLFLLSPELISDLRKDKGFRTDRPLIPLVLRRIEDAHLKGTILEGRTPFRDTEGKTWVQRSGSRKDDWAAQALAGILERLRPADPYEVLTSAHLRQPDDCLPEHYVDQILKGHADSTGREAMGLLNDWLADPQGNVFCAIFGELGMGKTTLCQRLTRDLLARRVEEPELPLPVYLDLRAVNGLDWDWSQGVPDLELMLDRILADAYNLPVDSPRPGVDDIRRLAQRLGGLVIFDGLDEVMNRLTPEHCRRFIAQLWSILPPAASRPDEGPRPPGVGRLVMTCRSHFFQTLQEQLDALSGRQRESVGRNRFWRCWIGSTTCASWAPAPTTCA
ncbi:MAG: NACHT domain-containing protein [Chromatiaceae bacterium]|nr:NACHT domain-containing protein [Chromatiaceae bacterium]